MASCDGHSQVHSSNVDVISSIRQQGFLKTVDPKNWNTAIYTAVDSVEAKQLYRRTRCIKGVRHWLLRRGAILAVMDLQEQAGTEEKEAEELQKQRTRQRCRMLAAMMALRGQHVAVALHGRSVNIDKLLILFFLPFFLLFAYSVTTTFALRI